MHKYINQLLATSQQARQELKNLLLSDGKPSIFNEYRQVIPIYKNAPIAAPDDSRIAEVFEEGFYSEEGCLYFFETLDFYKQLQLIDFLLENQQ